MNSVQVGHNAFGMAQTHASSNRLPGHRFLAGLTPQSEEHRVWVITGETGDLYYYNLYRGCLRLRSTLAQWALDHGLIVLVVTRDGSLDFSNNPDPDAAKARFEAGVNGDRRRHPNRFVPDRSRTTAGRNIYTDGDGASPPSMTSNGSTTAKAAQVEDDVRLAAASTGQPVLNLFHRITQVLRSHDQQVLVLVEDFVPLISGFQIAGQGTIAHDLRTIVQRDWVREIASSNLVIFLTVTAEDAMFFSHETRGLLPPSSQVRYILLGYPSEHEIVCTLRRMARRNRFSVLEESKVARVLGDSKMLKSALQRIRQVLQTGNQAINVAQLMLLPRVDEARLRRVYTDLNELIGLQALKDKIHELEAEVRDRRRRLELQGELPSSTLHMAFVGPPGTGKTTAANIVARFFHAVGLLRSDKVIMARPGDILSPFEGRTGLHMREKIEQAIGGVLFIDEAHQLGSNDSKSLEAVKVMVPMIWDHRHELVVILAGYELDDLLQKDEGLSGRFPPSLRIAFPNYNSSELMRILEQSLTRRAISISGAEDGVEGRLQALLQKRAARSDFGNARGVDSLCDEIARRRSLRPDGPNGLALTDLPPFMRNDPAIYAAALQELAELVGLEAVRRELDIIVANIQFEMDEMVCGRSTSAIVRIPNMLFVGPPGVGKTTIGRLLTDLLFGMGALERREFTEARREHFVGRFLGETAQKTSDVIRKARGGVLFIDEAYALCTGERDEFGQEAVNTLVGQMTLPENQDTVFVLAGYERRINEFLTQNDGLPRRFSRRVRFENFTPSACAELAQRIFIRERFTVEAGVNHRIYLAAEQAAASGEQFGNAGWVEVIVKQILDVARTRISKSVPSDDARRRRHVILHDVEAVIGPLLPEQGAWEPRTHEPHETALSMFRGGSDVVAPAIRPAVWQVVTSTGVGTGFTVTRDGVIATCEHVVSGARSAIIYNEAALRFSARSGEQLEGSNARVIYRNRDLDLAFLVSTSEKADDIEAIHDQLFLPLGESLGVVETTRVLTYGYAHSAEATAGRVTMADVARNREDDPRFIEIAGQIEPGFSGGPALAVDTGAVIGMVHGGRGVSATYLVRSEQIRNALSVLGYSFEYVN